uniref:Uncharacterized protein n=1 Tax=Anguilla anguilla TaxID=7936 RepID=A0A0E9QZQ6_ANGAN
MLFMKYLHIVKMSEYIGM